VYPYEGDSSIALRTARRNYDSSMGTVIAGQSFSGKTVSMPLENTRTNYLAAAMGAGTNKTVAFKRHIALTEMPNKIGIRITIQRAKLQIAEKRPNEEFT